MHSLPPSFYPAHTHTPPPSQAAQLLPAPALRPPKRQLDLDPIAEAQPASVGLGLALPPTAPIATPPPAPREESARKRLKPNTLHEPFASLSLSHPTVPSIISKPSTATEALPITPPLQQGPYHAPTEGAGIIVHMTPPTPVPHESIVFTPLLDPSHPATINDDDAEMSEDLVPPTRATSLPPRAKPTISPIDDDDDEDDSNSDRKSAIPSKFQPIRPASSSNTSAFDAFLPPSPLPPQILARITASPLITLDERQGALVLFKSPESFGIPAPAGYTTTTTTPTGSNGPGEEERRDEEWRAYKREVEREEAKAAREARAEEAEEEGMDLDG